MNKLLLIGIVICALLNAQEKPSIPPHSTPNCLDALEHLIKAHNNNLKKCQEDLEEKLTLQEQMLKESTKTLAHLKKSQDFQNMKIIKEREALEYHFKMTIFLGQRVFECLQAQWEEIVIKQKRTQAEMREEKTPVQ
jgi:hypothetical protein